MPKKKHSDASPIGPPRIEIKWTHAQRPAPLKLPDELTKSAELDAHNFDFSTVRKRPFSFDTSFQEVAELMPEIDTSAEPGDGFREPSGGTYMDPFDPEKYDEVRQSIPFLEYEPHIFQTRPLRSPESFSQAEKLVEAARLGQGLGNVTFVCIGDIKLDLKTRKRLGKLLCGYTKLECLVLRRIGLKSLPNFKPVPPGLKYIDVSGNQLSDLDQLVKIVARAPGLEVLTTTDNPVTEKRGFRQRLVGSNVSLTLRWLNGVAVTTDERLQALANFAPKGCKLDLDMIRWDVCFSSSPDVFAMRGGSWKPEALTRLELPGCDLTVFHVGHLRALRQLNIARNKISLVRGPGSEQSDSRAHLDLT
eukprot:TRINITY_DN22662_c0_g1_i1.p1 TRINITY_DN22662_c0_g1~~TRINITY_DN22662_c0_g1_i1.p1  ORF type:complete len:362 (+),score=117.48 TRINITY_DN22662_c0_g1_i1:1414-2499(+)